MTLLGHFSGIIGKTVIYVSNESNEEVLKQHGRCFVQSGGGDSDDMHTEGLCGADLQGEAVGVCRGVDGSCQ